MSVTSVTKTIFCSSLSAKRKNSRWLAMIRRPFGAILPPLTFSIGTAPYRLALDLGEEFAAESGLVEALPDCLFFTAQFAQIALVLTKKAAFDDVRSKGLIRVSFSVTPPLPTTRSESTLHLPPIADVLSISSLVNVVFYCSIATQSASVYLPNSRTML